MRRIGWSTAVALLLFTPAAHAGPAATLTSPSPQQRYVVTRDPAVEPVIGVYVADDDPHGAVSISSVGYGRIQIVNGRKFEAQGWYEDGEFVGIWRSGAADDSGGVRTYGWLRFRRSPDGSLAAHLTSETGTTHAQTWRFVNRYGEGGGPLPDTLRAAADTTGAALRPGDYVYVEELPMAVTKVPPVYPEKARRSNVEGTVIVQALIGRDGTVLDTRVAKSIAKLDDAAMAAVRQWRFKPAMSKGQPVAVWVAVPVKFTLN